jgi:cytochrome c553
MMRLAVGLLLTPLLPANTGPVVFAGHCAGCHGSDARGSGKGPGLAANPRLLNSPERRGQETGGIESCRNWRRRAEV